MMWREATGRFEQGALPRTDGRIVLLLSYPALRRGSIRHECDERAYRASTGSLDPCPRGGPRQPQPRHERELALVLAGQHRAHLAQRVLVPDDDGAPTPAGAGEPRTLHAG